MVSSQKNASLGNRGFQTLVTISKVTTSVLAVCFVFEPGCWVFSTGSCELSNAARIPNQPCFLLLLHP